MRFKKLFLVLFPLCTILSGCCLSHEWVEATCISPKTCTRCAETEGSALGHAWQQATCDTPKTCATCNAIEGTTLSHTWAPASCTEPSICTRCNKKTGNVVDHSFSKEIIAEKYLFQEATIHQPAQYYYACEFCGAVGTSTYEHGECKESVWVIGYYIDYKFGDATNEWYVRKRTPIEGIFSNSATTDSELLVEIGYDTHDEIFIFLYEYTDRLVKNSSSRYKDKYNISVKNDAGTTINATGEIDPGGDRMFISSQKSSVLEMMKTSKYMKVYIQGQDSPTTIYQFEVDLTDFAEILHIAKEEY